MVGDRNGVVCSGVPGGWGFRVGEWSVWCEGCEVFGVHPEVTGLFPR